MMSAPPAHEICRGGQEKPWWWGGHCQAVCLKGIRDPSDEEGGRVREEGRLARIELIQKYAQKPASTGGVRATRKKNGWMERNG